jgi:hypothetical protein
MQPVVDQTPFEPSIAVRGAGMMAHAHRRFRGLDGVRSLFAGADTNKSLHIGDPDLPVADLSRRR